MANCIDVLMTMWSATVDEPHCGVTPTCQLAKGPSRTTFYWW